MTSDCAKAYANNHKIRKIGFYLPEEQVRFIKDNGRGNDNAALAKLVNDKFGTTYTERKIGSIRYRYGAVSGLVTRVPNSGRFQKGHTPASKGRKQEEFMSVEGIERTKATRFKPGHTPANHRDVGSERINVYGYVEVKVAEPNKWRLKHQIVWEQHYGERIAEDMIIFLDGDKTNCSIENLATVTKSVNARLNQNHLRSRSPEITKVSITLGKLIAQTHKTQNRKKDKGGSRK